MHSLRAQVLALIVAVLVVTLSLFAYFGTRTANVQFKAIVAAGRDTGHLARARIDSLFRSGGLSAVRGVIEEDSAMHKEAIRALVIDLGGVVVASSDSALRGLHGRRDSNGRFRIDVKESSGTRRIEMVGGAPLRVSPRDTAALVFRLPGPGEGVGGAADVEIAARRFSTGFGRAVWLGMPALLVAASFLALLVTGRLLDPIRRLTTAAQGIAAGRYDTRVGATGVSELRDLALSFDQMAESLERSESVRRQVMRDVAHELRTPLTNLKAQIEALQDGLRQPDAVALASLHEEAALLERLVADVEVLARADARRLEMDLAPVELAPLVASTVHGFVQAGRLPADRISMDVGPGIAVRADRQRLGQLLRNLVDNAVRHGGDGVSVRVSARRGDGLVHLAVVDTGPGIPAEHVPHVFDRLYRVDASRTRATGGSGLGLSIVKALVEAQQGQVRLTSTEGRGTSVEIDLPAA